jgi:class 3 adenylate cyclase
MRPATRYAKSGNLRIAYQVSGTGVVDLVWAPGTISHLDLSWDVYAERYDWFGSFCRLIRFDKRGTGLSDRSPNVATLEERTDDIRAVMDAAGSERAVLFGGSEGANMACLFAAMHPERTRSLMIWGGQARWTRTDDYPWGMPTAEYQKVVDGLRDEWPSIEYLTGAGAGLGKDVDPKVLDWWLTFARASASPSAIVALEQMNMLIDTRNILPAIRVPTLVMNRTGDPVANVDAARDLAAHIPGARFVEFPGKTHQMVGPDVELVNETIREFVTGTHTPIATNRYLTTVLFLDIVKSTEHAYRLGDTSWGTLLNRFYGLVREELARYQGKEVGTQGDGFLATFDGPARAIRCAGSVRDSARLLGLEVRSGVHTGECERMGDDIGGVAVHEAARVCGEAGAGEVLVSSTVKDLVAGSGLGFVDRGAHRLKGIPGESQLFSVA